MSQGRQWTLKEANALFEKPFLNCCMKLRPYIAGILTRSRCRSAHCFPSKPGRVRKIVNTVRRVRDTRPGWKKSV